MIFQCCKSLKDILYVKVISYGCMALPPQVGPPSPTDTDGPSGSAPACSDHGSNTNFTALGGDTVVVIKSIILTLLLCPKLFQMTSVIFLSFLESNSLAMCTGTFL
jgi:hypothetical protein